MSFDSNVVSTLLHKKTTPQEKIKIINDISNNYITYEQKLVLISCFLDLSNDKTQEVREKTNSLLYNYVNNFNKYLMNSLAEVLIKGLTSDKHTKVKLSALKLIDVVVDKEYTRHIIPILITPLTFMLSDLSKECNELALSILNKIFTKVDNKDINPLVPKLIEGMSNSTKIATTIDAISSTTFVQNVDAETLSIIVPMLLSSFQYVPNSVKRQTIVIIENMTKLVEDAYQALNFIEQLLPILNYGRTEISEPEIRNVAEKAYIHLEKINKKGQEIRQIKEENNNRLFNQIPGLNSYHREIIINMLYFNEFTKDNLATYLEYTEIEKYIETIFREYNNFKNTNNEETEIITAEELCNCVFTLGYGSKVLLHQTRLHLYRGFKYGLVGTNNSGKSTLMRAMATRQLESFPQELRCVYVETDILGELSHLSLVDYILQDERLKELNLTREIVEESLKNFGFTQQMLNGGVSTLSGGWRMKLALSRAMMQQADILLMDEPSAHLDVMNVKWLLNYINSLTNVTCLIVSQNARLLDECCTHILHIENLKLYSYKGNLSNFVDKHPEAAAYFTLSSNKYSFKFPEPRFLDGVKSRGKTLMKMENVSFTYPGNTAPTITKASVQVSMASRIGCLGPNGAGKSTSIKILTGQLQPECGNVWTFPGVKIGYIAQHAFAHIEHHLDKTANEYIRWRYEGNEDKEDLMKITMKMTDEDLAKLNRLITIDSTDTNGKTVKTKRVIHRLTYGRRNGKREREYEVEFENCSADQNQWLSLTELIGRGYEKLIKVIDVKCDAAENAYQIALTQQNVETHLENIGMTKENATHVKIKQLSNGEKVKVVIGAALWMRPHILILDEPTNNIDRDGLSALKVAINEFLGGIIVITHDEQFCNEVCKEIWVIENGVLNIKGDPQWMANVLKEKIEQKVEDEMIDANGNLIKVKQPKKTQLTRKEKMLRDKQRKMRRDLGEEVSEDDED